MVSIPNIPISHLSLIKLNLLKIKIHLLRIKIHLLRIKKTLIRLRITMIKLGILGFYNIIDYLNLSSDRIDEFNILKIT